MLPHFEKISFRVNKKIFATLDEKNKRVCIKLPAIEQEVFSSMSEHSIYPVPNKWGTQGWTFIELKSVKEKVLADAINVAHQNVFQKNKTKRK